MLRWCIALILFLSIAWKITIPRENSDDVKDDLVKFFENNHFNVVVTDAAYTQIIQASTESCHLQIARLFPDGSNRDLIEHLVTGADRLFVVFRGTVYTQQPIFLPVLASIWSRFLRELGLTRHITPVIAVAANSACDAEQLPWSELSYN